MSVSVDVAGHGPGQAELETKHLSGSAWFFWIAGLSLVNSVIALIGSDWAFIVGLGITQVIDAIAHAAAPENVTVHVVAFALDLVPAGVFVVIGLLARRRFQVAYVLGIALYTLDAGLFVLVGNWLGLGFHGLALFFIGGGYFACRTLARLEHSVTTAPAAG